MNDEFIIAQLQAIRDDADARMVETGLFVAFRTPFCDMPDWLRERYPEAMALNLSFQFADLVWDATSFSVTCWFDGTNRQNGIEARIRVPFDRVTHLYDEDTKKPYIRRSRPVASNIAGNVIAFPGRKNE